MSTPPKPYPSQPKGTRPQLSEDSTATNTSRRLSTTCSQYDAGYGRVASLREAEEVTRYRGSMRNADRSDMVCQGSEGEVQASGRESVGSKGEYDCPERSIWRQGSVEATDGLRQKLEEVQGMLRQALDERTFLEERATTALNLLEERTSEVYAVHKQLEQARNHVYKAEHRLEATRAHFQARITDLEEELAAKEGVIKGHLEDRDTVRRDLDFERQRFDYQTTALTQELKAAYCRLDDTEQQIERRVESTKSHFQSQIDDLSDILNSRDSEIDFLSKELDKADACIEANRRHFQKQLEIYSNALKAKCAETDSIRQRLEGNEARLCHAAQEIQAKDALVEDLHKKLDEARRDSQVKGRLVARLSNVNFRQRAETVPVLHSVEEVEDDPMDPKLLFVKGALKCFNDKVFDAAFMCVQFLQDVQLKVLSASQEDRDSAERVLGSRLVQLILQRKVHRRKGISATHPRLAQLVLQLFLAHWCYAVMKGSYSIPSHLRDDSEYTGDAFHECVLDILHDLAAVLWVFGWRISGFDELVASLDVASLSERLPTLPVYQAIHSLVRDAYDMRTAMAEIPAFLHPDLVLPPCDTPFDNESMQDADGDFHTLRLVSSTSSTSSRGIGGYQIGTVGVGLIWDPSEGSGDAKKVDVMLKPRVVLDYTVDSLLK